MSNSSIKSKAKAAGLKSSFIVENNGLMTSFGKGNNAIIEKRIEGAEVKSIAKKSRFTVDVGEKVYNINGKSSNVVSDNPNCSKKAIGQDMIGCKEQLEKRYFGKTYNDNIHIQLIYNILDVEKILAIHANNIVYTFDNIRRLETDEYDDFIGYMSTVNSYEEFCEPEKYFPGKAQKLYDNINNSREVFEEIVKNPRLAYFGNVFFEKDKKDIKRISKKDAYYIFAMLGGVRQFCCHDKSKARHWLYSLDSELNADAKAVLDKYYTRTINSLNKDFVENSSKKDFQIIFNALNVTDLELKKNIAKEYYKFTCRKNFKNMGFSIKKLRETMLESVRYADLTGKDYDSVRSKLYRLIDFIIYLNYKDAKYKKDDDGKISNIVDSLRACLREEEKDKIYRTEADRLENEIKQAINSVKNDIKKVKDSEGKLQLDSATQYQLQLAVDSVNIAEKGDYFTKLVYLLTLFIDGKEINDLLTTLIHQFENIASFIDVMNKEKIEFAFEDKYKFFNDSKNIAYELRTVNSFARMTGFTELDEFTKFTMFREAADLLGTDFTDEELEDHLNLQKTRMKSNNKPDTQFRNFIISNVLKSSRFKYLIRYSNPEKVRNIAKNQKLVSFVLNGIPDTQIERYCTTCGLKIGSKEKNVEQLANIIKDFNFSKFENVNQTANAEEKAKKQGLISLYLTILYLLVKNLVYVNSRYFLAFHCLERDSQLMSISAGYKGSSYNDVTEEFVLNEKLNKHACSYLLVNMENSDRYAIQKFRNSVAHLNSVRNIDTCIEGIEIFNSYFDIYHYAMQNSIGKILEKDKIEELNPKTVEYIGLVKKYKSYCKDFVKALNVPFGYNLARYKNLSIEPLFDRNNTRITDAKKEWQNK